MAAVLSRDGNLSGSGRMPETRERVLQTGRARGPRATQAADNPWAKRLDDMEAIG
jgi:hypothetical protein